MKNNETKNKILTIVLLALGALMVITGIVFLVKSGASHTGYAGGVSRASTSIKFGADFYTESAQYTGLAANAVCDLYKIVGQAIGIFFMFAGAMDVCLTLLFSKVEIALPKLEKKPVVNATAVANVPYVQPVAENQNTTSNVDAELKQYKELLDSGIITQEEFNAKSKQLLG